MPVTLQPERVHHLSERLAAANASGEKIVSIDLRQLNRVLEYAPADMTITVEAGITLAALQTRLATHGQWLPIDPPEPERRTIGSMLATNASGPRRFGYGTVRDWLIGLRVALADGTVIKSGGKVVKNVAGYDLAKLFIGSRGTLGVIVEATFKLRPLPESETFVQRAFACLGEATDYIQAVLEGKLNPVVVDLHSLLSVNAKKFGRFHVVLGFDGAREDVADALRQAGEFAALEPADLGYNFLFWDDASSELLRRRSVLPSKLDEALRQLGDIPFIARAGNGTVYYKGGPAPLATNRARHLCQRIKDAFDPNHIFSELTE